MSKNRQTSVTDESRRDKSWYHISHRTGKLGRERGRKREGRGRERGMGKENG